MYEQLPVLRDDQSRISTGTAAFASHHPAALVSTYHCKTEISGKQADIGLQRLMAQQRVAT